MTARPRSKSEGSSKTVVHDCDPCKYQNIQSQATSYCTVCAEYLCKRCEQAHKGSKLSRDHKILTGNDIPEDGSAVRQILPMMLCDSHKTMTLNMYCRNHDHVICGTCKITSHNKCETIAVTKMSLGVKTNGSFDRILKCVSDLKAKYEKVKEMRTCDKDKVTKELDRCVQDIFLLCNEMKETIDKLHQKIKAEIRLIEAEVTNEIESHVKIADDALIQLTNQIKSLNECTNSQDNDVMYVVMSKAISVKSKYDDTLSKMLKEIYPINIKFDAKAAETLVTTTEQLKTLSKIAISKESLFQNQTEVCLLNLAVTRRHEIGVGNYHVFGCAFMPNGQLVLCFGKNGLKLFDKNFESNGNLSDVAFQVSVLNANEVIITQGTMKLLKRVTVYPKMRIGDTIKVDRNCYGLDIFNDCIYITCHDNPGNGEVQMLSLDGTVLRRYGVSNGWPMFIAPSYVGLSRDGTNIFVSDRDSNIVTCLNSQGHVIFQYSDRNLKTPTGLFVDGEGNVLVCGYQSFNVHIIKQDGKRERILLSTKHGVECPLCISYRQNDGRLVIGLDTYTEKALISVSTEMLYGFVK